MGRRDKYSPDVRLAISNAREEARRLRQRQISPEHLLLGMLKLQDPLVEGVFTSLRISTATLAQTLRFVVGRGNRAILSEPALNIAARCVLTRAEELAAEKQSELIEFNHLFLALLEEQGGLTPGVLESFGLDEEQVRKQLCVLVQSNQRHLSLSTEYYKRYKTTPLLNQVSQDLTLATLNDLIDPLIGREAELERAMQILLRRTKNNPLLIGPAGVGKTAIAQGLALRIVQGRVPEQLLSYRVVALDVSMLSISTRLRGDLEERLKLILQEICANPGIIVVIDELHLLAQAEVAEGSIALASIFKPLLERSTVQCIGATTIEEYRRSIQGDPTLERNFQPILVAETTPEQTLQILKGVRSRYEGFHQLIISDEALEAAIKLSMRYIHGRHLPDKALDLLDEAAACTRVRHAVSPDHLQQLRDRMLTIQREKDDAIRRYEFALAAHLFTRERLLRHELWQAQQACHGARRKQRPVVGAQDIARVVTLWTAIPVTDIIEEERCHLLGLERELQRRVVGQSDAVRTVASAVRRARAGISDRHRPIGSFVFAGPGGVGKTELALALAATLFGCDDAIIRFDMSAFRESHHVTRLIGSPPGYAGYDQPGQLIEAVRRRPYCVMLFDGVEQAHPKILDLLLQILEDGCLTDARGESVDFSHTLIILTSHIANSSSALPSSASTNRYTAPAARLEWQKIMRDKIMRALRGVFRPELLNRIDEVVIFHPLELEHLRVIADLMISQAQQRVAALGFELQVTEPARLHLISCEYNADYGARPLRRAIQSQLEDLLAEEILRGHFSPGDKIVVTLEDGKLSAYVQACAGSVVYANNKKPGHAAA